MLNSNANEVALAEIRLTSTAGITGNLITPKTRTVEMATTPTTPPTAPIAAEELVAPALLELLEVSLLD